MLDALLPALEAGRDGVDGRRRRGAVVARAMADAAEAGAAATIPMLATKGRASYLGERSIGHQDPGATSAALLLRALADVVARATDPMARTAARTVARARPRPGPDAWPGARRPARCAGRRRRACAGRRAARRRLGAAGRRGPIGAVAAGDPAGARPTACAAALETAADRAHRPRASRRPPRPARRSARSSRRRRLFARDPGIVDPALDRDRGRSHRPPTRSSRSRPSRPTAWPPSMTTTSGSARRTCATSAGGWPRSSAANARPDLWHRRRPAGRARRRRPRSVGRRGAAARARRRDRLAGGAPTGHAAIVARALGIPLVLGLGSAIDGRRDGVEVAVDGSAGRLIVEPGAGALRQLLGRLRPRPRQRTSPAPSSRAPDRTASRSMANVASPLEAEAAAPAGADGIGLVRTELLFLGRTTPAVRRRAASDLCARSAPSSAIGRSCSGRSTSAATSRRRGSTGLPRRTRRSGVRGVRLGQRQPDLLDDQLRRSSRRRATASCGSCSRWSRRARSSTRCESRLDAVVASVAATAGVRHERSSSAS